jgi:hypothetical protein
LDRLKSSLASTVLPLVFLMYSDVGPGS